MDGGHGVVAVAAHRRESFRGAPDVRVGAEAVSIAVDEAAGGHALVGGAVAVLVEAVTNLGGPRKYCGVIIIAVQGAGGAVAIVV
jgi:hypothetical protein